MSEETTNSERKDQTVGLEEIGLKSPSPQAFEDDIQHDEDDYSFDWPEVEWGLPNQSSDWVYDVPLMPETKKVMADLLVKPGIVVVGRYADDHQMAFNWLHQCLVSLTSPFTNFMTSDFDTNEELDEERLSFQILREYQSGCEVDSAREKGRTLIFANGPELDMSPDQRDFRLSRFSKLDLTLLCLVDNPVFRRLGRDGVPSLQLDTLDFAWRRVVHALLQDERRDVLDKEFRAVQDVLKERQDLLDAIRSQPDRRDDLREDVQRKLESGDYDSPVELCQAAIDRSSQNGKDGATNKRIMAYLGIGSSKPAAGQDRDQEDVPLTYAAMKETVPKVVEPFATVIFVMWACHQVQNDGIRETEFVALLKKHLNLKRMAEEFKLDQQRARAIEEEGDVQDYLEAVETPAKTLLEDGDEAIDSVLEVIKAQRFRAGRVPRVSYPHEVQGLLSSHLAKRRNYLVQQVREFEAALQSMRSKVPIVQRIGRMLFIHQAEEWGSMAMASNRDNVVESLVSSMTADEKQAVVADIARMVGRLANVPEGAANERVKGYVETEDDWFNSNVKRQRRSRARYVRELIADWYDGSLKDLETPEQIDAVRGDFSRLVTALLKRLLERKDAPLQWYSLQLAEFTRNKPELVDLRAVARQTANRQSLAEIDAFMRCIGELDVATNDGHLERQRKEKAAVSRARLHYDAYRYVATEFADEASLKDKSVTYRWFVVALAYRILPGFFVRLRQADYAHGASPEFSTDEAMEQILAEEKGIETFVKTMLCSRMRDYPSELVSAHNGLLDEHPDISPEKHVARVCEEVARLRFWIDHLWSIGLDDVDQFDETTGAESSSDAATTTDESSSMATEAKETVEEQPKTKPSKMRRIEIVLPTTQEDWDAHVAYTARISFHILQEFHEMLVCSGREAQAERLIAEMKASGRRGDLREVKAVVRWKARLLKNLQRDVVRYRRNLKRAKVCSNEDAKKVDRLDEITSNRLHYVGRFASDYLAGGQEIEHID